MATSFIRGFIAASALFLAELGGCGEPVAPAELLAPPPAGQGIQLAMNGHLDAGQENQSCQLYVTPPEGMHVRQTLVRTTKGVHHLVVYSTSYRSLPAVDRNGVAVESGQLHDCSLGVGSRWLVNEVIAVAQDASGAPIIDLPEDTAAWIEPNTVLLINTHYLNALNTPVESQVRINFSTIAASAVKHRAGLIAFYQPFIHIPAHSTSSARMRCPITSDMTIFNLQSHMHSRGVNFVADLTDGQGQKREELYTNTEWEMVPMRSFGPSGREFKGGDALDFRCDYSNHEDRVIALGPKAADEMCMLIGAYTPFDRNFNQCGPFEDTSALATFIGSGTRSCGETLTCLGAAKDSTSMSQCVVGSCAAVSSPLSALIHCQINAKRATCKDSCATDPTACGACVQTACTSEIGSCVAAKCS